MLYRSSDDENSLRAEICMCMLPATLFMVLRFKPFNLLIIPATLFSILLSACATEFADTITLGGETVDVAKRETVFGAGGIGFGDNANSKTPEGGSGIGVNAFLWRASLDIFSLWPIVSADPFGGVIITDWYAPPDVPNEKFKFNIFILDRALRADGVRVSIFKQTQDPNGIWHQAAVQPKTLTQVENAILTRARKFRSETLLR